MNAPFPSWRPGLSQPSTSSLDYTSQDYLGRCGRFNMTPENL